MGLTIVTPRNSYIRFDGQEPEDHCIFGQQAFCLPVYAESDIAFQIFVDADTAEEADALCTLDGSEFSMGLVADCEQEDFDIEFPATQIRTRISATRIRYDWPSGFPGMLGFYGIMDCFFIRVMVDDVTDCSNCFQRIGNDCFTSVIDYGNEDDAFGFSYCGSDMDGEPVDSCTPYTVEFINQETLVIPYTSFLSDKFGPIPTVQVWLYIGGVLVNAGISATFDGYPVGVINLDFGGTASGVVIIR